MSTKKTNNKDFKKAQPKGKSSSVRKKTSSKKNNIQKENIHKKNKNVTKEENNKEKKARKNIARKKELQKNDNTNLLLFDNDDFFNEIYKKGVIASRTPDSGERRKARFYNLCQFLQSIEGLSGEIVECGVWKGLSSYLMCRYLYRKNEDFTGNGYNVIDSFAGLSEPTKEDVIKDEIIFNGIQRKGMPFKKEGSYLGELNGVKKVLSKYPNIKYHKGWIPEVFLTLEEKQYKFVHIDLDIYSPIKASLDYFYPKLISGGIIVCDDYGSIFWPGATKAVEKFCKEQSISVVRLNTGQAVFYKI